MCLASIPFARRHAERSRFSGGEKDLLHPDTIHMRNTSAIPRDLS